MTPRELELWAELLDLMRQTRRELTETARLMQELAGPEQALAEAEKIAGGDDASA